ncbi:MULTISPECIES: universal stress protein [unclassified Thioalkalivibrio]|uniref:universal stress protein n=1 Tax=unclassified Thioalkalivibrio TaxID=2621013 RepID=UPI000379E97A|nr:MULTISPECIES: universal stress protein [unclassified Thioalkalivibrio]
MPESDAPLCRFETIVLATDGSEFSAAAENVALDLAQRCGARLVVARIIPTDTQHDALSPPRSHEASVAGQADLDALEKRAREAGIDASMILRHGVDRHQEIVAIAEEYKAGLIVIGRRDRGDLSRLMVGDATRKVIGLAPCNVMVVPRGAEAPHRGLLVGTDGSELGDQAVRAAIELAGYCDLPLTIATVAVPGQSDERRQEGVEAVQRLQGEAREQGRKADATTEEGRPELALVEIARRDQRDLIVLGSHGRTGLKRLLMGSVSERVIGGAECPVLVVKNASGKP